jgi:cysteinyl-tRNA synthetase
MSKSLKNFITVRDFILQNNPRVLRMFILKNHYRSPINYSEKEIIETKKQLERIDEFVGKLKKYKNEVDKKFEKKIDVLFDKLKKQFSESMQNDFNTPKSFGSLFVFINKMNLILDKNEVGQDKANYILAFLREIDKFLCLDLHVGNISWSLNLTEEIKISDGKLKNLVQKREKFRLEKNWQESDKARQKIKELGYQVEDTKDGPKIKKI